MKLADAKSALQSLREFSKNPVRAGRELRDALHTDSATLLAALLQEGTLDPHDRGVRYVMILLLHNDVLIPSVANPAVTTLDEAKRLTGYMLKMDPNFINAMLTALLIRPDLIKTSPCILRVLDIVSEFISFLGNWRSITRIHHSGDGQIKKKCAGLIAQYRFEDPAGLERFCAADPRIRANIVEILWSVDRSRAKTLLEAATQDGSNRVAGNAWYALYSDGNTRSLARLVAMLESTDHKQQVTAAWVMGHTHDARFANYLLQASRSDDPELKRMATAGLSGLETVPKPSPEAFKPRREDPDVLFLSAASGAADDGYELWLRVASANGEFNPNIRPVDFFTWSGEELVLDYSVDLLGHVHNAAVGIVFPAACEALVGAIQASVSVKAEGHRWALNGYDPDAQVPRADDFPRFEANRDALNAMFGSGNMSSVDAEEAVRNILDLDPKLPERHLVLILDGSVADPDPEAILSLCREKKFRLHCWRFQDHQNDNAEPTLPSPPDVTAPPAEGAAALPSSSPAGSQAARSVAAEKPRGARKFWEIEEEAPVAAPVRLAPSGKAARTENAADAGKGTEAGTSAGGEQRAENLPVVEEPQSAVLAAIVRDEEQAVRIWPLFVASLTCRYVLRARKRPTAVSIRKADSHPVRFSSLTRLLKGSENG